MSSSKAATGRDENALPTLTLPRKTHSNPVVESSLRTTLEKRERAAEDWDQKCTVEEEDALSQALQLEQQLGAALQSTSHLGAPNAFRTAICFDVLAQVSAKYERFEAIMGVLQREMAQAVYISPPHISTKLSLDEEAHADERYAREAARVQKFFSNQSFFSQLEQVLERKAKLQKRLDGLDAMHSLMLKQLRHEEKMVDKVAIRWARVLLKQTLVDWKKIVVRKKYTRVLLEKTSSRWGRQRLLRKFRQWVQYAKTSKVARAREMIAQCGDQTRDFEELLHKMETQIESSKSESKVHREHYDFAKRQILSLEELLGQLEQRVNNSNERKLQEIVNEWGRLCLAFVHCQLDFLQNMLDALPLEQYADPSLLMTKGEELTDLLRLPADALVLRWINYHLSKCSTFHYYEASPIGFIQNFTSDMKNNYVLRHLLQRVLEQKQQVGILQRQTLNTVESLRTRSREIESQDQQAAQPKSTPLSTKEDLRSALEDQLCPPCPPLLSAQTAESDIPSDLAFALFSFLACEHPSLLPTVMLDRNGGEICICPWREAQVALDDARSVWNIIRGQWTELEIPFAVREVAAPAPDLTSPPHLLVRGNIALQNAVNMVQYACSKRSVQMKVWGCLYRNIQQDAMRVLARRGRQDPPWEMIDRRLWRERHMLTTLNVSKLLAVFNDERGDDGSAKSADASFLEVELLQVERILCEFYDELRRVYRYYASIDAELLRTDHFLRQHKAGAPVIQRDIQEEERFFRKISMSMSLLEFHVFLKDCRVFGTARPFPYEFIERVFEQVNQEVAATAQDAHIPFDEAVQDHNVSEMTPAEFVEALVHIARSKYVRFRHPTHADSMSLSQRFRRMLVDVVLPNAMQEKERVNVFHEQLLAASCREVFAKHQKSLRTIYACFAEVGNHELGTRQNRMLSVTGLVVLLRYFEMLRENFLNLDEVQHVLSEVLGLERDGIHFDLEIVSECLAKFESHSADRADPDIPAQTLRRQNYGAEDTLLITYAEFLEVLAAVACYLRPDAFVPLADKLDDFFTEELRTRSLPPHFYRDKT